MTDRRSSCRGWEDGSTAVEAGVIMSVLLLLIVGSVEFGRAFWTYNTMLLAVEEAGRYAMLHHAAPSSSCSPQTQASQCPILSDTPLANCSAAQARQILTAYQVPDVDVSVIEDTTSSPATITICASYSFVFSAAALLPGGPLSLTSRITVPVI
jgi:Flp pilus assembly protein TadG